MHPSDHELQQILQQAVELHQNGKFAEAIDLYSQILAHYPDADLVLYNHGLACYEAGRYEEAITSLERAAAQNSHDPDIWFNLGLAYKQTGRFDQAEASYRQALELSPGDTDTLYNLARCFQTWGKTSQAMKTYEDLLTLAPEHESALNNLAYLLHRQGDYRYARTLYRRLLDLRPDHAGARHMLAALSGAAASAPPAEYVRDLFDGYSQEFEQSLVNELEYRVPDLLFDLLQQDQATTRYAKAVDLGCGTGLAGERIRPLCDFLAGVDLSAGMIAQAGKKKIYDQLDTGEVVTYLTKASDQFDLLLAADLLTYLGDLAPLFRAAALRSTPEARFVFSTEHSSNKAWVLRASGRYAHTPDYIQTVAHETGWQILHVRQEPLRREGDDWVQGDIYLLVRHRS